MFWRLPATDRPDLEELAAIYRDLHAHPELAFAEHRTAGIVAKPLRDLGYQVTTGVAGTGVVGVLAHGTGPTVLLRADMDGLLVLEQTGLVYASSSASATAADRSWRVIGVPRRRRHHICGQKG
jgi:metal-dependent amidase/aminoacylase/carboxypeptidase family protein